MFLTNQILRFLNQLSFKSYWVNQRDFFHADMD